MSPVDNNSFKSPIIGTDPVTKGTFIIESAYMIWNYDDWDYGHGDINRESRAKGEITILGTDDNPLFKLGKEEPLRLQGLVASVKFGTEKRFIRFVSNSRYALHEDELFSSIELDVVFDILDNLEYLEHVNDYKNTNLL